MTFMNCRQTYPRKADAELKRLLCLVVVLLVPALTLAQSYRGSIRGKVVDPSGGLIVGAKVTAKNDATGLVRDTVAGADGAYVLA